MREDKLQLRDYAIVKRVLVALLIVIAYVCLSRITLPGLHVYRLDRLLYSKTSQNLSLLMMLAGGNLNGGSLVSIGFMPFILIQMLLQAAQTGLIPAIKRMSESPDGTQQIGRLSIGLSAILDLFVGYALLTVLNEMSHHMLMSVNMVLPNAILLMTGSTILLYLTQLDTLFGLGNGLSFLIAVSVLTQLFESPQHFYLIGYEVIKNLHIHSLVTVSILGIGLLLLLNYVCYWFQTSLYRIPLQFVRLDSSLERDGHMMFSFNIGNVMPLIITSMLMSLCTILAQAHHNHMLVFLFNLKTGASVALFVVLLIIMSVVFPLIQFYPKNISKHLSESGVYLVGVVPGKDTVIYLRNVILMLGFLSALFYGIVVGSILLLCDYFHLETSIAFSISSVLIVLVSMIDVSQQLSGLATRQLHADLLN